MVGAGPAGATMALLLAERGIDVTLIERETDLGRVFRGEGLMPSGVDALEQMGAADVLDHVPCRNIDSCGVIIPKGGKPAPADTDWLEQGLIAATDWLGRHIRQVRHEIEGPDRLNVIVGRARTWHRPGLLMLGDAAHPMSPVRAQGVNHALRDSIVAANQLVPVLKRQHDESELDAALEAVQSENLGSPYWLPNVPRRE